MSQLQQKQGKGGQGKGGGDTWWKKTNIQQKDKMMPMGVCMSH
jgi:hypothetical protein